MKPTIGRIVHYTPDEGGTPRAAIVTDVGTVPPTVERDGARYEYTTESVNLEVLGYRSALWPLREVPYADEPKPGHWNWPPREPAATEPGLDVIPLTLPAGIEGRSAADC